MLLAIKIRTAASLGLLNLIRVVGYRIGVKAGFNPVRKLVATPSRGVFFSTVSGHVHADSRLLPSVHAGCMLFSYLRYEPGSAVPDWHLNPLTGIRVEKSGSEWWQISDFDPVVGDIKTVWELSRFDWVLLFAQQARAGDHDAIQRLNNWLNDWCENNSPYKGPNWKCGQEASIRVMHLAMASLILQQHRTPQPELMHLVSTHLKRISPTLSYAMAQDNNHGSSEAAALFIGGSWLMSQGMPHGKKWKRIGTKWLENRANRLIESDGSFSQYSLNYHRVMLDTFSMVEVWRRELELQPFSTQWYKHVRLASEWLRAMINPVNGDGPNLGANDGARLLQLTDTDYRDYRPSVQLSMALFANQRAYADTGVWDLPLRWLGIESPKHNAEPLKSQLFDLGGYGVLRAGEAVAMLRYPRFRFRPSHADALHLDLWYGGRNLLRDGGTYSYNTESRWLSYFPGTESHNTIQFDGRDQMPRLSRFLFGDWLKTNYREPLRDESNGVTFAVGYRDAYKASHKRKIYLTAGSLRVIDEIDGFKQNAVLRWRLEPGGWFVDGNSVINGEQKMTVCSSIEISRFELIQGWESRYYLDKQPIPVLEVEVVRPGTLTTEYRW